MRKPQMRIKPRGKRDGKANQQCSVALVKVKLKSSCTMTNSERLRRPIERADTRDAKCLSRGSSIRALNGGGRFVLFQFINADSGEYRIKLHKLNGQL